MRSHLRPDQSDARREAGTVSAEHLTQPEIFDQDAGAWISTQEAARTLEWTWPRLMLRIGRDALPTRPNPSKASEIQMRKSDLAAIAQGKAAQ